MALHELAKRLLSIRYTGPTIRRASLCQRHNGHIRVIRIIRGEIVTLGITDDMGAAAFYSDCLTRALRDYLYDMECSVPASALNFPECGTGECPEISALANEVVQYLKENEYLRDFKSLYESRLTAKKIIADFDWQLAKLRKIESDRVKAIHHLEDLYRL